jgi:CheY-like chemotaxis protein
MPSGGRLDIGTADADPPPDAETGEPGSSWLLLTVSDTGMGMSPEVQAHIFEPFYTTKDIGRGTGLGLATVHGIVSQTGGTIEVRSTPGQGTRFLIHLPCATDEVLPPPEAEDAEGGGDETVLLVEDDGAVRDLVAQVLRRRGYRVLEALDGGEAELRATSHPGPLHLLVTDIVMPGMDGLDLARRLLEARPGLRVLLISGYGSERVDATGLDPGSVAFLQKPFSPGTLARRVREVLDRPRGASSTGGAHPA